MRVGIPCKYVLIYDLIMSDDFLPKVLCLDLETSRADALRVHRLAAWRADTGEVVDSGGRVDFGRLQGRLDALADGAAFVLGHNLRRHDLPVLRSLCPALKLHALRLVDTLELSPITHPANPYHRLVKDYKLLRDSCNDPLADAKLAFSLWKDQFREMQALQRREPERVAAYHYLLAEDGLDAFFVTIRRGFAPAFEVFAALLPGLAGGRVCTTQLEGLLPRLRDNADTRRAFAYVLAWLGVAGGNSVMPPWVRKQYPQTGSLIAALRETPCNRPACTYCSEYLDVGRELKRHFGFDAFRPKPCAEDGGSLQEAIVRAGYAGRSLLAILPTGGGKSICYQLPALSRYWRRGSLTVVISPLQSLMKDQVDNLRKAGVTSAYTLNGMLSMPERKETLEKVRLGDASILLVSPEQFRNRAFASAIALREIACWVFDEAHCLSRWGHDFRPDYLYVTRFIRERHGEALAPVCAFTATAKRDVVEDLLLHFRSRLGLELTLMDGGVERRNLHYDVMAVEPGQKWPLLQQLLRDGLSRGGGAVVFVSRRKSAEETAAFLDAQGWRCRAFHAGLPPADKQDIQNAFIAGQLQVIVATNAFGMGVDKSDVRLVVHCEIPGSLENYLQEAGRAGRDQHDARCVLLYAPEDVDAQFRLAQRSRLTRQDIAVILRALRRQARGEETELVLTSREILRLVPQGEADWGEDDPDADTRVRTALHWLEEASLLTRNENRVQIYPGSLKVQSLQEAGARLATAGLPPDRLAQYQRVIDYLINTDVDEGVSTDELTLHLGLALTDCIECLRGLEKLGLLSNDMSISCRLRKGVADASLERLQRLCQQESELIALLREAAPDAPEEHERWQEMSLRAVCQSLRDRCGEEVLGERVLAMLRSLGRPLEDEAGGGRQEFLRVRLLRREALRVCVLKPWRVLEEVAQRRRTAAQALLGALLQRCDPVERGANVRVSMALGEMAEALLQDMTLAAAWQGEVSRELAAVQAALMFMHDNEVLVLDKGRAVFRPAMSISLPTDGRRGFRDADYAELRAHYQDKTLQIHVVQEYARLGLAKMADALDFVLAYFSWPRMDFLRRYFALRDEEIRRAASQEAYQAIVGSLNNSEQRALVCASEHQSQLVLAGPGSGKTRVIVHRVAYLVRIVGELPERVLVLTYNRAAAWEVRERLWRLLGGEALGVTVLTYHALALRLTGRSLAGRDGEALDFDALLRDATELLNGQRLPPGMDADALRDRLLGGYRHILVDEYQDIDQAQYELIAALAGRRREAEERLTLMAVGDDDQNIYAFRDTSNAFIRRFAEDYEARTSYLVHNYRSSAHIIAAANLVIGVQRERMKQRHPVRVDKSRASEPPGGRWEALDPLLQGRVQLLRVGDDALSQAQAVVQEMQRRLTLSPGGGWGQFAVLSRTHAQLQSFVAWCESAGIPYQLRGAADGGTPPLYWVREGRSLLLRFAGAAQPLSVAALAEEASRRSAAAPGNEWLALCAAFCADLHAQWGNEALSGQVLSDALYEFSRDAKYDRRGALTLSTVHQAKGGEWAQVLVLDGVNERGHGVWCQRGDDERRLFYVAMTRAAELLTLCWGWGTRHAFVPMLEGRVGTQSLEPELAAPAAAWKWIYLPLGLGDVFLSFAGGFAAAHPVHAALERLEVGAPLTLRNDGRAWRIYDELGTEVGRLAREVRLPAGELVSASVNALVWREREQGGEAWQERVRCEGWWVVLPRLVIRPAAAGS